MADQMVRWPKFGEPATKGDLIRSLAATRRCIVDIYVSLSNIKRGNMDGLAEAFKSLDESDERLAALIDEIGGATVNNGK